MIKKILLAALNHKIITALIIVIAVSGGYYGYQAWKGSPTITSYTLAAVEKGTIVSSVSGSGQVSASNQVDVTPKVSGTLTKVAITAGQEIKTNDLIAQINAQTANKTVRDAKANLESAKLSLEKLQQPATDLEIMQARNAVTSAQTTLEKLEFSQPINYQTALDNKTKAENDLTKAYEDAYNAIASAFLNLPEIITGLNTVIHSTGISQNESTVTRGLDNLTVLMNTIDLPEDRDKLQTFQDITVDNYDTAREKYDVNFENYKNSTRYSSRATIDTLLTETEETTKSMAQAAKSESNYLDAWADIRTENNQNVFSAVSSYQTDISGYISQTNTNLSSLLSIQQTIVDDLEAVTSAANDIKELDQNNPKDLAAAKASVAEKEESLANLLAGTDALDLKTQQLSIQQKENALADAYETLADYTIRAPFAGVAADVDVKVGDSVSSGTVIATLISKQNVAEISLNEVDMANVKIGQKATLTFDAISDLTITGSVIAVDTIGTVSQGVVTYTVKIGFDTEDSRVKPGMSVSASITTDVKQDVLMVPNSAIKSSGSNSYVETTSEVTTLGSNANSEVTLQNPLTPKTVETGLSNDSDTEIVSGLNEGDIVITRTITNGTSSSTSSSTTNRSILGGGGFGGGRPD